jgi:hypothetical protein
MSQCFSHQVIGTRDDAFSGSWTTCSFCSFDAPLIEGYPAHAVGFVRRSLQQMYPGAYDSLIAGQDWMLVKGLWMAAGSWPDSKEIFWKSRTNLGTPISSRETVLKLLHYLKVSFKVCRHLMSTRKDMVLASRRVVRPHFFPSMTPMEHNSSRKVRPQRTETYRDRY